MSATPPAVTVGRARAAATRWVAEHAAAETGYRGAYFSGSTVGAPPDSLLAPTSDVDVVLVLEATELASKPGKFRDEGVPLEVSYVPWAELSSPEAVLGSYHLVSSFRTDAVIDDPTGHLRALHTYVAPRFADPEHVERRCLDALGRTFDATAAVARTPFLFSSDITAAARPIAIDGSRALIDRGDHREAVFWILATYARCQTILTADAPALAADLERRFRAATAELASVPDAQSLPDRAAAVTAFLPDLWTTTQAILATPRD